MTSPDRPTIPTSTSDMLERTRRRAEQMRRRRRAGLSALAAVVVALAIAVPVLNRTPHHASVVGVTGEPTSVNLPATTTPTTSAATTLPATTIPVPPPPPPAVTTVPRTTTTTAPAAVPECATSQLRASLTNGSGAAGSVGYDLNLLNTGSAPCSLTGYPGVSYVTASNGTTVGAPASRDAVSPVVKVILAPGHTAKATLIEVDSLNYPTDTCQLAPVGGVRIYPPNQTATLFVPQSLSACSNPADPVLQVGPVEAS